MAQNIVIRWLQACSNPHRQRLASLVRTSRATSDGSVLDAMAAMLLAECAGDLGMKPEELASLVGDPRKVGREAVLELALAGIQWSSAA